MQSVDEVIVKLRRDGHTIADIASRIGVSPRQAHKALTRLVRDGQISRDEARLLRTPAYWKPEYEEEIIQLRNEGKKAKDIAARFFVSESRIRTLIRRFGRQGRIDIRSTSLKGQSWNRANDEELIMLRMDAKPLSLIAARFGTSQTTIRKQLKRLMNDGRIEKDMVTGNCKSKRIRMDDVDREILTILEEL
jgi:DNA-binding CsgD family transcriptional regulator